MLCEEGNTRYKEKQVVEEFLRSVDDTCHGSTQIRAKIKNLLITGLTCPPHQQYHAIVTATPWRKNTEERTLQVETDRAVEES